MQSFCCKKVEEKSEVIKYICLNENCQSISVCCEFCKQKSHTNHQQDCQLLRDIIKKTSGEYQNIQNKFLQQIQEMKIIIEENIDNLQKNLKNIFKTSINEDELIFNLDYAHIRKSQLKCFFQAQQLMQQQIIQLKQISNQIESRTSIILQDITQCEKDINIIKQQQSKQIQIHSQINIQNIENLKEQQKPIDEIKLQEKQINKKIIFLDDDEDQDIQKVEDNLQNLEDEQYLNTKCIQLAQKIFEQYDQEDMREFQQILQEDLKSVGSFPQGLKILFTQSFTAFQNQSTFQSNQSQRINEIFNKPLQYFCNPTGQNVFASDGKDVKFSDVIPFKGVQGCFYYVMFYLASFCPQKLYNVFKTKEISSNGLYEFVIEDQAHNDKALILQVDDFIPNNLDKRMLLTKNNSICFTMLMKVIAENYNGYEIIFNSQNNPEFLNFIFQTPLVTVGTEYDDFSEQLKLEIDSGSLILFPLRIEFEVKVIQVLEIKNVKNLFNDDTLLFKLRSAYGRNIYKGEWGFQSPYWTDDMKETLNISVEDDGIFYMDFLSLIQVPKFLLSFRINQQLIADQKFVIKKKQASYFCLEVHQKDNYTIYIRHLQQMDQLKSKFKILISEYQSEKLVGIHLQQSRFSVPQLLDKGTYVIYIKCNTESVEDICEGNINIFGSQKVELSQIQKIENYKKKVFDNEITLKGQIIGNQDFIQQKILKKVDEGWVIFQFNNFSNETLIIKQGEQAQKNCRICKPYNDKLINQKLFSNQKLTIICKLLQDRIVLPTFNIFKVNYRQY